MSDDVLEQLRNENPVPHPMAMLPIEPVLRRLDHEPPVAAQRSHARRARARRVIRAMPVALSAIVVLAVATVAVTIGGNHRVVASTSSRRGLHQAAPATSATVYFLDYLLPTNGADWAAGRRLTDFTQSVAIKAETACLRSEGFPGPPIDAQPSASFGSEDFPNMPVIKRTSNVGVTTLPRSTDPANSLPPSKRSAYNAVLSRCEASAPTTRALSDNPRVNKLMGEWMTIFTRVSASPAVRAANRRAAACSRPTPFPASTVGNEIETIEARLTPLYIRGNYAQARATNANGVRVLIRCFGTVETLRDRLMAAQRVRFLARHAQAVRQSENRVNRLVAADKARYGVKLDAAATK